jgi:hypothetical protein
VHEYVLVRRSQSQHAQKGRVDGTWGDHVDGVIEPIKNFTEKTNLVMPKILVNSKDSCVAVSVMNLTDEPIRLREGTLMGDMQSVVDVYNDCQSKQGESTRVKGGEFSRLPEHLKPVVERCSDLTEEQREKVSAVLSQYEDVFVGPDGKLGHTTVVKHTIDTGDARPVKLPPRRLPLAQRDVVKQEVDKMLNDGIIEPSSSPWASPVVLVKKKDNSVRFCIDFRRVNAMTRKDAYPLPRIQDSLDALSGAEWFSTIDLASSFWQVGMDEKDQEKTAFTTPGGLYSFKVMPFGLVNAPATCERLMELVLCGLQWERCLVYLDDVMVFGKTCDEALENFTMVLDRLRNANLILKPKKCDLFRKQVTFLGSVSEWYRV